MIFLNRQQLLLFALAVMLSLASAFMKYRSGDINYRNSDAAWHTLLTVQAYHETPSGIHKFLPIVSLGQPEDKNILWGATIPDKHGNYYYTSFSPAGYIVPYLAMKILRLPVEESSIYIINSILYALSSALWGMFICRVFRNSLVSLIASAVYIFTPEIMHGMGLAYWHHSVMQVTLIVQAYSYFIFRTEGKRTAGVVFFVMCLLNPYIEWSGYTANIGFIVSELLFGLRKNKQQALKFSAMIGGLTVLSGVLFCAHYLSVVGVFKFFKALLQRFMARNFASSVPLFALLKGYAKSLLFVWPAIVIMFVAVCVTHKSLSWLKDTYSAKNKWLLIVLLFPLLENVIMKQHAISYTFDRMKLIFPVSFILCDLCLVFLRRTGFKRAGRVFAVLVVISACCANYAFYVNSRSYIWPAYYRKQNRAVAKYINANYDRDNSILALDGVSVRGYMNLLFQRGIYEWKDIASLTEICRQKDKHYIVLIKSASVQSRPNWSMTEISGAKIYDVVKIYDAIDKNSFEVTPEEIGGYL
ncbi:MAG: hypothetical protein IJR85_10800 [Synergistaceae bacterium]|nr:hypothetical protein [Synergistaceae bacterium]